MRWLWAGWLYGKMLSRPAIRVVIVHGETRQDDADASIKQMGTGTQLV